MSDPAATVLHMSNPEHILWIDLESTDNDPDLPHAAILEIGAIITRWEPELPEVARASLLIRPPGLQSDHDLMWSRMPAIVQQMHSDNGLWAEATTSDQAWTLSEADRAFSAWVVEEVGPDPIPLAGSGVGHMDHAFVKALMPHTAQRLTYWPLDIGNVRRMLELAGRGDHVDLAGDVDAKPHRALGDVEMHVTEARRYLELLGRLPTASAPAPA